MKDSVEKLKIRMSKGEQEWWESMIKEEHKVQLWDSLSEDDYRKAGETLDLLDFKYTEPEPAAHLEDEVIYKEQN